MIPCLRQTTRTSYSLPRRRSYGFVTQSFLRGVGTRDEPLRTFAWEARLRMTGTAASRSKNRCCTSARKFYGQKPYYAEKYCDKRFLDRVINLIPDSGLKALWSLIPFFWALSLFLLALIPVIFLALSPEPIYHVTTLLYCKNINRVSL